MNLKKLDYIQYICEQRLKKYNLHENQKYVQRLERELTNIDVQNLQDYVLNLLEKDVKVDHHGSLVYYLLGISSQDPIATNQPLKVKKQASFPDIDSDFSINERGQVIKYFIDKYGSDHVAAIGSYGQMKMKSVIRDVARIYDIDLAETNDVAKNLQDDVDNMSEEEFDILIAKEPADEGFRKDLYDLRLYLDKHSELREIIFLLKGQLRHLTKHPAGVVATPTKINETIPLMKHKNELITSWVDGIFRKDLQSSGFIKFDILGLKTLTIIKEILELIRSRQHYNKEADFDISEIDNGQMISLLYEEFSTKLPLDGNDSIYERFRTTETNGIFQFECLAGYTWIGNNKIENLYQKFIKGEELDKIASANIKKQQKIRQRIVAMKKQRKQLYRVVLVNSQCIDSTILHKYYTKRGWEKLQDIKIGDRVLIDQGKNRIQYACSYCNEIIDHIGVCKTCAKAGKRATVKNVLSQFKQYKKRFKFMKIKNIIPLGFEDVYDIAVENKPHNYIANGFVVHNSSLMKSLLKEIKPTSFMDITSATALGRPGPLDMGMHHEYAARKNGKTFDFGHKLIEKCLKDSYGILVYQEDVMRLCNIVAGFPLDLTDTVRKNLMKSIRDGDARDKSAKEREKLYKMFIQGCEKNGLSKETAESWWQGCVSFTRYGFNKSHAVSYTILSYQMMWFKVYYPLEFYVVLFSNSLKDKFTSYFAEAMNKGINLVPADINKARESFTIQGEDTIMFGLAHITNIGPAVVDVIIRSQPFANFQDFFDKTAAIKKIGKGAVEALINAHAFDCFGTQNEILEQYFTRIREEKDWTREVDYEDKKFEHEMFVESYGLDWRTKLTDEQKAIIKQFEAKSLTKVVSPKPRLKLYVYGIVNEVIKKTSKNGNDYFNIILTDAKFNMAKLRIPTYNRRSKHAKVLDRMTGKYKTVKINDVIQIGNILLGEAESSEYHNFIFVDLYEICCIGNIFDRSKDQLDKLGKYDKIYDEIDIHEKEY